MGEFKGAFDRCGWCHGRGCLQCPAERKKYEASLHEPIFTADPNDPEDMRRLREVVGRESLEHAFGPDGGGMQEIREKAAIQGLLQALSKSFRKEGAA